MAIRDLTVHKTIESVTEISPDWKVQVLWDTVLHKLTVADVSEYWYLLINMVTYPRRLDSASPSV